MNVHADALALKIKAPSLLKSTNVNEVKMSDEILSHTVTIHSTSTVMKHRISNKFFSIKKRTHHRHCVHGFQRPELLAVSQLPEVVVTGTKHLRTETVVPKHCWTLFLLLRVLCFNI